MGATTFDTYGVGKTLRQAFDSQVQEAAYMYGHGGYTGTIAEKDSVVDLTSYFDGLRISDKMRIKVASAALGCYDGELDDWTKKQVPSKYHSIVSKISKAVNDKWGPAGAIELNGTIAKNLKKGTRGKKAYIIFGWASE